jgi:hypothetical protein
MTDDIAIEATNVPTVDIVRPARWLVPLVLFGIALRLIRLALDVPLWGDEAFVAVNFLDRGYRELLAPLEYGQICPILFLWAERLAVDLGGFSEPVLRAVPALCGIASMPFFAILAWRTVPGRAAVIAVAVFAGSVHPVRLSVEVKPYASDLLVALLLLIPAVSWIRDRCRTSQLWLLAAMVPFCLAASHPAVFVCASIGLALTLALIRARDASAWRPFLVYCGVACGAFALLYFGHIRWQSRAAGPGLVAYWVKSFPPFRNVSALVRWFVAIHTGTMFAYPGGGQRGGSALSFLLFCLGMIRLIRRGDRLVVVLLLAPFALALVAAAFRRYPYGGEARQMQFLAPAICMGIATGIEALLSRLPQFALRSITFHCAIAGLVLMGMVPTILTARRPYLHEYDRHARLFARQFWPSAAASGFDLACARWDFGVGAPGRPTLRTALYLCNQMIYSPARRHDRRPHPRRPRAGHPLRCVVFADQSRDTQRLDAWLATMQQRAVLTRCEEIWAKTGTKPERWLVYEFQADAEPARLAHGAMRSGK